MCVVACVINHWVWVGMSNERDSAHVGLKIGRTLELARKERGLSLGEVEEETKIRARYLRELERENFEVLPAVYMQGFLKTYANFLGLDGEQLSRELKSRSAPRRERQLGGNEGLGTRDFDAPSIPLGDLSVAERRRISGVTVLIIGLAVLMLAAVAGGLYLIGAQSAEEAQKEEAPAGARSSPSAEETGTKAAGSEDTTAQAIPGNVQAAVRVVGGSSGLTILTDGTVAYDQVAQPNFSRTFEARNSVRISAADGGVIEVEVNGRNLGRLGNSGQPVTRDFTPQSPEVTTRAPS